MRAVRVQGFVTAWRPLAGGANRHDLAGRGCSSLGYIGRACDHTRSSCDQDGDGCDTTGGACASETAQGSMATRVPAGLELTGGVTGGLVARPEMPSAGGPLPTGGTTAGLEDMHQSPSQAFSLVSMEDADGSSQPGSSAMPIDAVGPKLGEFRIIFLDGDETILTWCVYTCTHGNVSSSPIVPTHLHFSDFHPLLVCVYTCTEGTFSPNARQRQEGTIAARGND